MNVGSCRQLEIQRELTYPDRWCTRREHGTQEEQ